MGCAPTLREERGCFPGVALLVDEVDLEVDFGVSGIGVVSGSKYASFEFEIERWSEESHHFLHSLRSWKVWHWSLNVKVRLQLVSKSLQMRDDFEADEPPQGESSVSMGIGGRT